WPEAHQLVGVDDRADACDLTAGDLECHHGDQPLLCVEIERSRATVDLDGAQRQPRKAGAQADPVPQPACDMGAPAQRPREPPNLPAAGAVHLHVVSEKRLEPRQVAFLDGRKEQSCQLVALLARRSEAGPPLFDVASRSRRELTDVALALADYLRDL